MSERIVDDPSLHGWVDDNGKWVWEGGLTTGHIQDGDNVGEITTWDGGEWTPDSSLLIDSAGNSTFSGDTTISKSAGGSHYRSVTASGNWMAGATGSGNYQIYDNTAGQQRLTIDSAGNVSDANGRWLVWRPG